MKRVLTGVVAIPIVVGIVYYGSPLLFLLFVAAVTLMGVREYFTIIDRTGISVFPIHGIILSFLLLLSFYFNGSFMMEWGLIASVTLFAAWFFHEGNVKVSIDQISFTLFGILYTAGLGGYFLLISKLEGGRQMIVFILLFVWTGDSAAFYVGRKLGERKLLELVSPNKTIAGAVANVMGTLIAALLASSLFFNEIPLIHCLIVAFICGIIGQFGDLAESLIKRNCQVKDSGTLIPGHGGVLDRIDSLLFVGPAFYCYYQIFLAA